MIKVLKISIECQKSIGKLETDKNQIKIILGHVRQFKEHAWLLKIKHPLNISYQNALSSSNKIVPLKQII